MCKSVTDPLAGVLEISTEDGVLRLAINGDAAKDLKIDLDQFLAQEWGREALHQVWSSRS